MNNIKVITVPESNPRNLINPACVIGMPGIADIGKFAVDQMIGLLKAKRVAEIIFYDYPAGAIVENSVLSTPKAEVLYWKDPNKKRDLFLITADAQAMTPHGVYEIADFFAAFIQDLGVQKIISLGAFPMKKKGREKKPQIFATATTQEELEPLQESYGCLSIGKGVIVGANGLIPTLAKAQYDIEGVVLLAETDNIALINEEITDLGASVALIKVLAKYLGLDLKSEYSTEKISEMTKTLEIKRKKLEEEIDPFQNLQEQTGTEKSLYI